MVKTYIATFIMLIIIVSCNSKKEPEKLPRPNILFCIADDASYPYMGAYGYDWIKTPAFDKVASRGLLFNDAYTPNAKCGPSRAIILTGRHSWQLEEAGNYVAKFPKKFKSFMKELNDYGYQIGYTGKGWAPGDPGVIDGKARELTGKPYKSIIAKPPTKGIKSIDYAANFNQFLSKVPEGNSWCFWYGGQEPHRNYEYGSGIKKGGKSLSDIDEVPKFWPDNDTIRTDMLDYAYEVEYFDTHLSRMMKKLEEIGQLDNTIIVVTSDNGMPFPRGKAQKYEISNHMPFAIMWPKGIKNPGRVIDDYISFIDIAPTFLDVAQIPAARLKMQPITGQSLVHIFKTEKDGMVDPNDNFTIIGRERHDYGRPNNQGYPVRRIVKERMLYLHNFKPELWPSGNPETGYMDCDASPTKTFILNQRRNDPNDNFYWNLAFGKRPLEELYNLNKDRYCMQNLAEYASNASVKEQLKTKLFNILKKQKDPRMFGNGDVFDNYSFQNEKKMRNYYERFIEGDPTLKAGWINKTDVEKEILN